MCVWEERPVAFGRSEELIHTFMTCLAVSVMSMSNTLN